MVGCVEGSSASVFERFECCSCAPCASQATDEQQTSLRGEAGAIADLARDLGDTTEIMERLKLLLADRSQTLDGEMAEIQVCFFPRIFEVIALHAMLHASRMIVQCRRLQNCDVRWSSFVAIPLKATR